MEQYAETARERTQEDKIKNARIDDWLPITSSRTAKWYYSAFHNVTAMVGAGVLGLPFAMSQLGWYVHAHAYTPIQIPTWVYMSRC
jgi:hypothetical protein